ncbi:hypothetical protein FO519_000743 [Halicephalobus sp. NKZ332]|nr:hypothetical protein FO519_000743 [Halicephalobus sp. NKZ332]
MLSTPLSHKHERSPPNSSATAATSNVNGYQLYGVSPPEASTASASGIGSSGMGPTSTVDGNDSNLLRKENTEFISQDSDPASQFSTAVTEPQISAPNSQVLVIKDPFDDECETNSPVGVSPAMNMQMQQQQYEQLQMSRQAMYPIQDKSIMQRLPYAFNRPYIPLYPIPPEYQGNPALYLNRSHPYHPGFPPPMMLKFPQMMLPPGATGPPGTMPPGVFPAPPQQHPTPAKKSRSRSKQNQQQPPMPQQMMRMPVDMNRPSSSGLPPPFMMPQNQQQLKMLEMKNRQLMTPCPRQMMVQRSGANRVVENGTCNACNSPISKENKGIMCTALNQGCLQTYHLHCENVEYGAYQILVENRDIEWVCRMCCQTSANLLLPGIVRREVVITPKKTEYYGFFHSALNTSEVAITVNCEVDVKEQFTIQYVLRSTPCAKEFFIDKAHVTQLNDMMKSYFDYDDKIPSGFYYDQIYYYKSSPQNFTCDKNHGVAQFVDNFAHEKMKLKNVSTIESTRRKRDALLNRDTIDGGAKSSLTSWHPAQILPADAIYILIVKIDYSGEPSLTEEFKVVLEVQWRNPYGYLSAIDYPLLHFYGFMCAVYICLAVVWLLICFKYWMDLLRIQFWIGAVIIVGMVEKAVFYAEYANMNEIGESVEGLIEFAELISCFKRTMAHVLIIIVSVGYGVVKPRLGSTLNQVAAVGVLYFVFCSIEGLTRVSKNSVEATKEKQVAKVPLVILEIGIAYWIFTSLIHTMRSLRIRKNEVKLALYRYFTNVLCVAIIVAVVYMMWSIYIHSIQYCLPDWQQLWIDTAFWHVFFCSILIVVMYLWRPAQNNQRYAFTPLLDDSENENDDDELFNSQIPIYDMIKHRQLESQSRENRTMEQSVDDKLEDDLRWIESNIPSSLAEALLDQDEEDELRQLEMSKML